MPPDPVQTNTVPFRSKQASSDLPSSAAPITVATLDDFAAESKPPDRKAGLNIRFDRRTTIAGIAVLLIASAAAGAYWVDRWPAEAPSGSLRIESDPPGAEVRIGGTARGTTPVTLSLAAGSHVLTVEHGGNTKQMSIDVTAGVQTIHHITWAESAVPSVATETGSLYVATDPPGATVTVDGVARGRTPLTITNLAAGGHQVVVSSGTATDRRSVQIQAAGTASLVISRGSGLASSGWMSVSAAIPMQILENGRLIGSTEVDRIMLPAGEHAFEFVSAEAIGFRTTRNVKIIGGQTESVALELPRAPMNINAIPWAEVFIDGVRAGETPIANLMQTVGSHEIVFRHPELGDRRVTTVVTLKNASRVSVDMRAQ